MIALEPVISVSELPPARSRLRKYLPSLRTLVSTTPAGQEANILAYLAQGVACGIYHDRGLIFDVLQPDRRIDNPNSTTVRVQPGLILTDGTWVWPGELPYYVARYHLRLPDRFIEFANAHQWQIDASIIDLDVLNWDSYDAVAEPETASLH